jgi:F-type H+-transporting ATPase subunit a
MLYSILTQPSFILAHLVPLGTPSVLIPFMVIIELIRTFIRPFTLAVRLTANIIAGHLLLVLLRSQAVSSSYLVLLFLMPALVIL